MAEIDLTGARLCATDLGRKRIAYMGLDEANLLIDGWDAALFVQRIKTLLETPAMIFVET